MAAAYPNHGALGYVGCPRNAASHALTEIGLGPATGGVVRLPPLAAAACDDASLRFVNSQHILSR